MLVWFNPFQRHKKADKSPQSNRPTQGRVQRKNTFGEHLLTPSGINAESMEYPPEERKEI
jgi:hypothetical protein